MNTLDDVRPNHPRILTINGGSSSLKFALFDATKSSTRILSGRIERIGSSQSRWVAAHDNGDHSEDRLVNAPDLRTAAGLLIEWLDQAIGFTEIAAIGHRIVHGGPNQSQPAVVTTAMIEELRKICPWDPEHLPGELDLIEAFRDLHPKVPQVACFDTAFHHEMPKVAQIVAIPRRFASAGIRRYGFHGISYSFLMDELAISGKPNEATGNVILAHLGAGASLAAVQNGRSIDTTMGFTPASGLVMGTRSGDIDPGIVRFLQQSEALTAEAFDSMVNHESGLLGVSEISSDLRDLLARQSTDFRASEAIELFCYKVKKGIGGFAAALGGLDTLVFSGGIGENSPEIRRRICSGLGFLGIGLSDASNESGAALISDDFSRVRVRVIRTDEERMIATSVARQLNLFDV